MLTQTVAGRTYDYSHAIGRGSPTGLGFQRPISLAFGEGDVMYVVSRGGEGVTGAEGMSAGWNRTGFGVRVSKITVGTTPGDEELVAEFGKYGDREGEIIWPAGIVLDSQGNVYVTDEWLNRVSIFDKDGNFLRLWGAAGHSDGELDGPSGIDIDKEDNLYIVDSRNHRVQKFTKDGKYLAKWGNLGAGDGEFDSPWGITLDKDGFIYVADHKNDRVQKFTPEGKLVAKFGSSGTGAGELNRPAGVAVDPDGDVYVCDWANNRVQSFGPDGGFITSFIGDAHQPSKWGQMTIDANLDVLKARRRVYTFEPEWRFSLPVALAFDAEKERLVVADTQRQRLQLYNKVNGYADPQFNL